MKEIGQRISLRIVFISLSVSFAVIFAVIISIAALPFLGIALLVTRLVQFVRSGHAYHRTIQFKFLIRAWIFLGAILLVIEIGILLLVAKRVPSIKHIVIAGGLTLIQWVNVVCIILGFFILSLCLSVLPYYMLRRIPLDYNETGINVPESISEIIICVMFLCGESQVKKHVPALNHIKLLGLHLHKWIEATVFVLIGYNIITLVTHIIVRLLRLILRYLDLAKKPHKSGLFSLIDKFMYGQYIVYFANGLKHSFDFVLSSVLLLVTWQCYFGSHLPRNTGGSSDNRWFEMGTWTCVSILICSLLWVIKDCLLLAWEAHSVYNRLKSRILNLGNELYFLGILGRHTYDIFDLRYDGSRKSSGEKERHKNIVESFKTTGRRSKQIYELILGFLVFVLDLTSPDFSFRQESHDEEDEWSYRNSNSSSSSGGSSSKLEITSSNGEDTSFCKNKNYHDGDGDGDEKKWDHVKKLCTKKRDRVKDDLLKSHQLEESQHYWTSTVYGVQLAAQCFVRAKDGLSNASFPEDILDFLNIGKEQAIHNTQTSHNPDGSVLRGVTITKELHELIATGQYNANEDDCTQKNEWNRFIQLLETTTKADSNKEEGHGELDRKPQPTNGKDQKEIYAEDLEKWLEIAHSNCFCLASTISSANEAVKCLNKIISGILIGVTFILWLFFTGLATTKALVLITSPILATTFIFGDTCKTFFQGIIFIYLVRPFDVGDLCRIADELVMVNTIGIWTTTFSQVNKILGDKKKVVIYPNSMLAGMMLINQKLEYDWDDYMEFPIRAKDPKEVDALKKDIENYLVKEGKDKFVPRGNNVMVGQHGEGTKICINFKHRRAQFGSSYLKCKWLKQQQRSALLLHVRSLIDQKQPSEPSSKKRKSSNDSTRIT